MKETFFHPWDASDDDGDDESQSTCGGLYPVVKFWWALSGS